MPVYRRDTAANTVFFLDWCAAFCFFPYNTLDRKTVIFIKTIFVQQKSGTIFFRAIVSVRLPGGNNWGNK